jgi:hypothetical protein
MTRRFFISALLFIAISSNILAQTKFIPFNHKNIVYEGRINKTNEAAKLYWSGTSVTIRLSGEAISAVMQDADTANYYNVIVDGKVTSKIHVSTAKQSYSLASGLSKGKHTIQLYKRTEWDKGTTTFYGFEIPTNTKLLPPAAPKKRKIEFFGNSITCGYGIEDNGGDSGKGYFENNYLTYAALTARHFDAQCHYTAKSGIGIMVSWFPLIMPEMYDRINPKDSTSKWDFSQFTPDLVVVNLFQNDSWLVEKPNYPEFKHRFGTQKPNEAFIVESYRKFIETVRKTYPKASIICALGSMDATREGSPWPGYIEKAVSQLNDKKVYTHFLPYKKTGGHPKVAEQKAMADDLIQFIEKNVKW